MKAYVLSAEAQRDVIGIRSYVAERSGFNPARSLIQDFTRAFRFVARNPGSGHVRTDLTHLSVKFWPVHSYVIIYDPSSRPVEILRVLHGMRDLESILN
jgi:toxin ParE1/3/4